MAWRPFFNAIKLNSSSIDLTLDNSLLVWIDTCYTELGSLADVMRQFIENPQGLVRLDRHVGSLIAKKAADRPMFAVRVNTYTEHCHHNNMAPSG